MLKGLRLLALLLVPAMVLAQTVYESRTPAGKVYSDRPSTGGKAVELPPLTVIEPLPREFAPRVADDPGRTPRRGDAPYRSLAVVFPEDGGSVAANYATFEVRLAAEPPLRVERGHAFSLILDGQKVPGRYTGTEIMFPPEFFGDVAPAGVQRHVLEARIIDGDGRVLQHAPAVNFQTRFVNVLQRPHVQPPQFVLPPVPVRPHQRPSAADFPTSPFSPERAPRR